MISLHSHSGQYCMHAHGELEAVVEQAIALGFTTYGLSEHMPRTRTQDLYPEEAHLQPADTRTAFEQFHAHARELQARYSDRIQLLVGMETELIHEATMSEVEAIQQTLGLDYMVGSVHHVREMPIDFDEPGFAAVERLLATGTLSGTEAVFQEYFDAQYTLLRRLKPTVVGHFDLVRKYRGDFPLSDACWTKIRRNVDWIVEYGGLVEINTAGWRKGLRDAYPQRDIIKYMVERGVQFCLSDDSHGPGDVGHSYEKIPKYLDDMGIKEIYYPAVASPCSLGTCTNMNHEHIMPLDDDGSNDGFDGRSGSRPVRIQCIRHVSQLASWEALPGRRQAASSSKGRD
ncbi:Polymerase/histidinol phosphatase-like protein [Entophlyctis helioformis]|nr:Polymerase/histidinol phosphatase-like protein [Entophlyctis helioformis]